MRCRQLGGGATTPQAPKAPPVESHTWLSLWQWRLSPRPTSCLRAPAPPCRDSRRIRGAGGTLPVVPPVDGYLAHPRPGGDCSPCGGGGGLHSPCLAVPCGLLGESDPTRPLVHLSPATHSVQSLADASRWASVAPGASPTSRGASRVALRVVVRCGHAVVVASSPASSASHMSPAGSGCVFALT